MAATAAAASPSRRWLFSALPDLLFGCGLLYAAAFTAQVFFGPAMREWVPYAVFPFLTLALGAPHYGATLIRAYGTAESRRRYAPFSIWLTLFLAIVYVVSLRSPIFGSWVITLYVAWSPWHYSGQNYGVAMTFLRRRAVALDPVTARLVRGTFVLSFLLTLLVLFGPRPAADYAPANFEHTVYRLMSLGIPAAVAKWGFLACLALYAACVVGAAARLLRRAPARELLPVAMVVLTQMLWFAAPTAARSFGLLRGVDPLSPENGAYTFMWIAAGHFIQYLWITTYYAGVAGRRWGKTAYLTRALLAGALIWVGPAILFAPNLMGPLPFDLGLGLLTAAVVNLHHFVLDGAIWKLRDGRIARVLLLADRSGETRSASDERLVRWLGPAVLAAGAVCVAVAFVSFWEPAAGHRAEQRGDVKRATLAMERIAWIGRDSPRFHVQLAQLADERGDRAGAQKHLQEGLALYPTLAGWSQMAEWHERGRQWTEARAAWQEAASLAPDDATIVYRLGLAHQRAGELEQARDTFRRAIELAPEAGLPKRSLASVEEQIREREAGAAVAPPDDPQKVSSAQTR
jgi:tetratricopeptide (TPR) repeat protein